MCSRPICPRRHPCNWWSSIEKSGRPGQCLLTLLRANKIPIYLKWFICLFSLQCKYDNVACKNLLQAQVIPIQGQYQEQVWNLDLFTLY